MGVWNPQTEGFIGVREKFNDKYLFTESLYTELGGTAQPIEALDFSLAPGVLLREYVGSFCRFCEQPVEDLGEGMLDGRKVRCVGYTHVEKSDCEAEGTHCAYLRQNQELFDLLLPWDETLELERQEEWNKFLAEKGEKK